MIKDYGLERHITLKVKKCAWCGKSFDPLIVKRNKYCSEECAYSAHKKQVKNNNLAKLAKKGDILKCKHCGKEFIHNGERFYFCSGECEYIARQKDKRFGRIQSSQPCWSCQNACGGCSWSSEFKPVEGWKAKRTKVKCEDGRYSDSYKILFCPEYIPDDD